MRKNYILTAIVCFFGLMTTAQVTIDNGTFPVPGDTLRVTNDVTFSAFDPTMTGTDLTWDFTGLTETVTSEVAYSDAAEGEAADSFPDADLLVKGNGVAQDIYYKSSNNRIVEIGRAGLDPVFGAVDLSVEVTGNSVLRRAPLAFGDTYDDNFGFAIELPTSVLPDSIANLLVGVTDIRVTVDISTEEEVDAWGTLSMPDRDYEVVRLNRETTTTPEGEVKFFGTWVNLSNLPIALPDFVAELITPTVTNNYIFFTNDAKEELVNVLVDSTMTIVNTTFKANQIISSTNEPFSVRGDVVAYPNPSYGNVNFAFKGMPADAYKVEVYDVLGRKSWSATSKVGQTVLEADLSHLRRGTYLYRLFDSKGQKITTKRLMIVRP